jgi:hypothetical protein
MLVEFIGLPGAGKTSIIQDICNNPDYRDRINLIGKKKCNRKIIITEIIIFFIKLIFIYPKILLNIKSSLWLLKKISIRLCHRKNDIKDKVCLLNESGIIMPIISFITQRDTNSYPINLNKIISVLPIPDVVVFIDCDIEIVVDRYADRGGPQTKGLGIRDEVIISSELYEHFALGQNALLALKYILKRKKCTVITMRNNSLLDYETISSSLCNKLISKL